MAGVFDFELPDDVQDGSDEEESEIPEKQIEV